MANNNLATIRMLTFKVLDEFLNNLKVVSGFNYEFEGEFGRKGAKIGDTLYPRKPQRWLVKTGAAYQEQPLVDTTATIRIDRHRHIGFDYGAFESTLSLDDMYNRYFAKQTTQLANQVDDEAAQFAYLGTNNNVGTMGANPTTLADSQDLFLTAYAILMENGCPTEDLTAVFWPRTAAAIMKYLNTNYNPQSQLGKQFLSGNLVENMFGFKRIAASQNIWNHTIATVNNVNPKNRRSTGVVKRFVVATDLTADSGGNMTIPLGGDFSLAGAGNQYQNVDALPADNAALTIWNGTSSPTGKSGSQSLAFGPNAFAYCPITLPDVGEEGAFCSQATDPKTKSSMTMVRQVNAETYRGIARMDMGFGFGYLYPDAESVRIVGA